MKTQVYNLVILDKSGSMESIRKAAVDGYNETLGSIKAAQLKHLETQEHYVSLAAFCDCGIQMIYDKTPIKDADKMKMEDYLPCCSTPLFDAIGKTVRKMQADTKEIEDAAVLVTIITDGYENASHEWDGPSVKKLIDECKKEGWMFSFIGAGEDVVKTAMTISITNTMVWKKTEQGTQQMFETENIARDRFYDKMEEYCAPAMSACLKKKMRRGFSEDFYKEEDK